MSKNTENTILAGKTAVVVCHDAMFGPPHEVRDYLLTHGARELLFIGHRNRAVPDNHIKSSYYEVYRDGKRVLRHSTNQPLLPESIAYVRDFLLTIYWCLTVTSKPIDIYVGAGNLNAFAGLLLRVFGRVNTVIYYVIDYIPDRYGKSLMNWLYRNLERVCADHAITWNYAPAMIAARNRDWDRTFPRQFVVPNGIHIRKGVIQPYRNVHKSEIIYLGTFTKQQGVQLMVEALPGIVKRMPSVTFSLIGRGAYRGELEKLAKRLGVVKYVRFLGYIDDPVVMERRLAKAALGVATYEPQGGFVQYTEPGKVKRYLAAGVPVVMTDVSPLAREIERKRCGFRSKYTKEDLAHIIVSFLSDNTRMKVYRKNAVAFAGDYTWERILTSAFQTTMQ